jgi:outer membrane protein TolC
MEARTRTGKPGWLGRLMYSGLCMAVALWCGIGSSGCTRQFFRKRVDEAVGAVLAEKDRNPAWKVEQWHGYPDPRARFADPTDPDRPPKPPDDPASYDLSPNPQRSGKAGVARVEGTGYLDLLDAWDADNRAEAAAAQGQSAAKEKSEAEPTGKIEAPPKEKSDTGPIEKLPVAPKETPEGEAKEKPEGQKLPAGATAASTTALSTKPKPGERPPYLLKLEQAVELGLINSREYQDAREDLYLTALPVTMERFAFAAQFFAAGQAIRQWAGRLTPEGHQDNWTLNSNAGFSKLFTTGALLLFNFANQTVFNFTGVGRNLTSQSTINLDLVQPLLRGGGRAVALEPLTQTERNLLYQLRTFARFRKTFYVAIAGGGGGSITGATFQPSGVIAPSPFAPAAGLGGSGLVPGVVPPVPVTSTVGLQVSPGSAGRIGLQTAFAAPVSGYLTTLLQAAQMQVDEYNIAKLEAFLQLGKAMEEGGDISELQVQQFEQSLLRGRTSLLTDQQQYLQSLDQFKLQLGLPTDLPIMLDDSPFRPLNQQFQKYEELFKEFVTATQSEPLRFASPDFVPRVRTELLRILTSSALVRGTRFRTKIEASWRAWQKLSADELRKRLASYRAERRRLLDKQTDLEAKGQSLSSADQQRLKELSLEIDLGEFEAVLRGYESQPWRNLLDLQVRSRQQQLGFRYVVNALINVLTEARNERLEQLRGTWPDLAKLCVSGVDLLKADLSDAEAAVIQTALVNRLDLMNARAQVVDAWRQLAVFANALLGVFNVQYHMDSSTPAGMAQPLAFSASRTRHQLFLNTELPLVRMTEQNNYRASLINYQRARRILMRAEDQVAFDTRSEIRQLRQQEENYRIQQRQVELGYLTVENSLDTFQAPPAPVPAGQAAPDVATRAATLTNQLITAQTNLYTAQFTMTTIWITYLNTRLQLYRDMELMPLDYRGVWIDEIDTRECPSGAAGGSSEPGRCCPGAAASARGSEWPEQHPEPKSVTPAQGTPVEQAR